MPDTVGVRSHSERDRESGVLRGWARPFPGPWLPFGNRFGRRPGAEPMLEDDAQRTQVQVGVIAPPLGAPVGAPALVRVGAAVPVPA